MLKTNILIFLLSIIMLGCYPEFNSPLSEPENSAIDERLLGTWSIANKKNAGYVHIEKDSNSALTMTLVNTKNFDASDIYTIFSTQLDNSFYMNLQDEELRKNNKYIIAKYIIKDKKELNILMIENNKIIQDIKKGKLDGKISGQGMNGFSKKVEINEPSQVLAEYLKSNNRVIFDQVITLQKVSN